MKNKSYWLFELHKNGSVNYQTAFSNRFVNDKVSVETDNVIVLADGLVLNKKEIVGTQTPYHSLCDYYLHCFDEKDAIRDLRGPFVVLVYDKQKSQGMTFANQTGDVSVYYGYDTSNEVLYMSNNFNVVAEKCKRRCINEKAAHHLLTYGYLVDDSTIISGIYKLQAGRLLCFSPSGCKVEQYHRFNFHDKIEVSMEGAIEQVDKLFRRAVKLCFEKDLEYGYTSHIADLSAGLDSRLLNVVAKEMGYTNIINISYSQSGSDEQKFAQKLSFELGNSFYHHSMDDASFLYDIEDTVREEFGMVHYNGITAARQFLRLIDFDRYGIECSGQIGDAVITNHKKNKTNIDHNSGRQSSRLPLRFIPDFKEYSSEEEFMFYAWQGQGVLQTNHMRAHYTYTISPFFDPDLIAYCASLPDDIRSNHRLYWNWIDNKYPKYSKIPSTRERHYKGMGLKRTAYIYYIKCKNKLLRQAKRLLKTINLDNILISSNEMNPFQYWYNTNPTLRKFIDDYYYANHVLLKDYKELSSECKTMFESPSVCDKLMCISLLAGIKEYCTADVIEKEK